MSVDNYVIREAVDNDFEQVLLLYRQLQPNDPILSNGQDQNVFLTIVETSNLHIFVVVFENKLIASSYLNIIPNITRAASPYAVIENVITDGEFRAKGIGQKLMKHTLEFAWQQGCYKAMLMTGSKESSTHAFYEACGFNSSDKTAYIVRKPV